MDSKLTSKSTCVEINSELPVPDQDSGRRPFLRRGLISLLVIGGLVGFYAFWAAGYYHSRALAYDLDLLGKMSKGCVVLDRQGEEMGKLFVQGLYPIRMNEIPQHFINALLATEDVRYFEHGGNDFEGIIRAAWANILAGRVEQGASTITQQLTRQVYELQGRTLERKGTEAFLARRIEKAYTKQQILESYLNRIYFGNGSWGLGAAARNYFDKDASELSVIESALLCGIIKRPYGYSPTVDRSAARIARNHTLDRMAVNGFLAEEQSERLKIQKIKLRQPKRSERSVNYLFDMIEQEAEEIFAKKGWPAEEFVIHTSAEPALQDHAARSVSEFLTKVESKPNYWHPTFAQRHSKDAKTDGAPNYLQAAVVVLDNWTGGIVTAVGGRDFRDSEYNRVNRARRRTGTAFLPLVYAAAFDEKGISPSTQVMDLPLDNRKVMIGGDNGILGEWGTEELENVYEGEISAGYALLRSKTGASVRIGNLAGLPAVKRLARGAGVESVLLDYPSTFLGNSEMTLLELTRSYSIFANLGWAPMRPSLIEKITENGRPVYQLVNNDRPEIISETTAGQVSRILQASMNYGPLKDSLTIHELNGTHVAGKSGTVYGFTDAWFVGYSARYTCGVWVGFDQPESISENAFGKNLALPIWVSVMNQLGSDTPLPSIPSENVQHTCLHSGCLANETCQDSRGTLTADLPFSTSLGYLPPCSTHIGSLQARPIDFSPHSVDSVIPVSTKVPVLVGFDPWGSVVEDANYSDKPSS